MNIGIMMKPYLWEKPRACSRGSPVTGEAYEDLEG
jgi:hypothetical protein